MATAHNKGTIGPKLREAIRYLLEVQDDLELAAKHAGISSAYRLRESLKKPHVRAYFLKQKQAVLDVYCAGNPGALRDIRDKSENQMARVQAIRTMEQLGADEDQRRRHSEPLAPGLVVVINSGPSSPRVIEHGPALSIEHRVDERKTPTVAWPMQRDD